MSIKSVSTCILLLKEGVGTNSIGNAKCVQIHRAFTIHSQVDYQNS